MVRNKEIKKYFIMMLGLVILMLIPACSFSPGVWKNTDSDGQDSSDGGRSTASKENSDSDSFIFWNQSGAEGVLAFATEDMDGNEVTSEDFKGAKLILVNYWEPWCGPCVSEMPDLEQLYEKYRDQGFVILGVFSTTDMDEDVKGVLSDSGTSYPILRANRQFTPFMTGYYPTSFFMDGSGKVLSKEPVIGSLSYDDWEKEIISFLEDN